MTPILFLDIDGVLNGDDTRMCILGLDKIPEAHQGYVWLCPERIKQLNKILDAVPDTKVILSSTWREYGLRVVEVALRSEGFRYRLRGLTPPRRFSSTSRAMEIEDWFRNAGLDFREHKFVILDDLDLSDNPEFKARHVQTTDDPNFETESGEIITPGFSDEMVQAAINLLT
ncbi:MAG: hypothetical protein LAT68_16080 [Cyclobacteriaceae bacterium]|nr:hypothetical protein [Cyclobacteriaceae bacterium]